MVPAINALRLLPTFHSLLRNTCGSLGLLSKPDNFPVPWGLRRVVLLGGEVGHVGDHVPGPGTASAAAWMKERSAGTRRSSEVWLRNTRRPGTAEAWQSRRRVGPSVLPWLRPASVPIPPLGADRWLGGRPDHGQPVGVPAAEPAHRGAAVHVEGASQRCVDWLTNAGWRDYAAGHAGVVDG